MLATLQSLGVMPSFSRPAVSNDNPYSESIFKTLKYRPDYPHRAFENLFAARQWVGTFVHWYNHEHCHSAIRFVTPHERHAARTPRYCQSAWTSTKQQKQSTLSAGVVPRATGGRCRWFTSILINVWMAKRKNTHH